MTQARILFSASRLLPQRFAAAGVRQQQHHGRLAVLNTLLLPQQQQRRGFATSSDLDTVNDTFLKKTVRFLGTRTGMIAMGGSVFAIVIGRIVYKVTAAFVHLDFYTVAEVGFAAGFTTTASGFAFATYLNRLRHIDVEKVVSDALEIVQRSPKVAQAMGLTGFTLSPVQTGTIRTYQIEGGHFGSSKISGFPAWKVPKVQVMFQVWGGSKEKQAIVVAEAYTDFYTRRQFSFISFDLLEGKSGFQGDNPTVIVYGDDSQIKVRNDMRSFVTLNRVYVRGLE